MKAKYLALCVLSMIGLAACDQGSEESLVTSQGSATATAVAPAFAEEDNRLWTADSTGPIKGSAEHFKASAQDRVFFAFDKAFLDEEAKAVIERQIAWFKEYPNVRIIIEGHCDERGTAEYNIGLGDRRATAVKKYFISQGIDAARITVISYGKEKPAVIGHDESAWSQNRRAVTVIAEGVKESA